MNRILLILSLLLTLSCEKNDLMNNIAPIPKKIPYELKAHDYTRIDEYYWLRDDSRSDPAVIEYLKSENLYTSKWFASKTDYKKEIVSELLSYLPEAEKSFTYQNGEFKYFSIQQKDQQLPIYYRSLNNVDEVVLDPNKKFTEFDYYNVAFLNPSPNNALLAFAEDTTGRREYLVKFINLQTQEVVEDVLRLTTGNIVWLDQKSVLYLQKDPITLIANKLYIHTLGDSQDRDKLIYQEQNPEFNMNLYQSIDSHIAFVNIESTNSNEIRYLVKGTQDLNIIHPRETDHLYYADALDQDLFIRSNRSAPNFAVYKVLLQDAQNFFNQENLILNHDTNTFIEDMQPHKNFVALSIRVNGLPEIGILRNSSEKIDIIKQPEESYASSLLPSKYQNQDANFYFEYSSLISPSQIIEVDYLSITKRVVWETEVTGYLKDQYETSRHFIKSRDGTNIPLSVVKKKTTPKNSPILFYGYGSYGINTEANFRKMLLPLLDRGFIYVMVNIRGGGEMGKHWYDAGRMQNKMNTFYDFNDAVHAILENGLGDNQNVFAQGGSAGGLLMGAVINLEPTLYKGILSGVPFVDVLTTMSDPSIPLTTFEYDEWGNPGIKEEYEYMSRYSPYDNISALPYPAVFVTSSLYDSQVQYFEPAKYVPKLREYTTSEQPILLKMNLAGGHGGKSGIINSFEEKAEEYNFLLNLID